MFKKWIARLEGANTRRKAAVAAFTALAACGVLVGLSAWPTSPEVVAPKIESQAAQPAVAPDAAQARSRDALWNEAAQRLDQADLESAKAVEARLAELAAFLGERKKGATAFAEDMTGMEAKMELGLTIAWLPLGAINEFLGGDESGPTRIEQFAASSFSQHVLRPGQLRETVDQVVNSYVDDLKDIHGRLLVDLRLDLADDAFGVLTKQRSSMGGLGSDWHGDGVVPGAIDTASYDALYSIGSFIASMWASDKLTDQVVRDSAHPAVKFGANVAIGNEIDKFLGAAAAEAGYDPKGEIIRRVSNSLDALQAEVIDGDSGLRRALQSRHESFASARRQAVRRAIYGSTAPEAGSTGIPDLRKSAPSD